MSFSDYAKITNTKYGYISEASFSAGKLEKVAGLYGKILGKKMGGEFKVLGTEKFKGQFGSGIGVRTMNNAGAQLRFNFDENFKKYANHSLTSITYWNSSNVNFTEPDLVIVLHPEANVQQIAQKIANTFKSRKMSESTPNAINEVSKKDLKNWLSSHDINPFFSAPSKKDELQKQLQKKGLSEEFALFSGQPEKNSFEDPIKKAEKQFEEIYADPDLVFQDIEELTKLIAMGKWKSLIICGMGGIGKTYHVKDITLPRELGSEGDKWTYHSGPKAAPWAFYKTTFLERNKIIVWDECDSLLKNGDIIMMLKPTLDTSGDNAMEYMSGTRNMVGLSQQEIIDYSNFVDEEIRNGAEITMGREKSGFVKLPSKFYFTGGMIFISNMRANELEEALLSRSLFVDVYLSATDAEKRVETILRLSEDTDPDVSREDVDEVMAALGAGAPQEGKVQYMTPEYARKKKKITVRAGKLGLIIKKAGLKNWSRLVSLYA